MADEVLTEVRGRVLLVTLNRPAARNAATFSSFVGKLRRKRRECRSSRRTLAASSSCTTLSNISCLPPCT